MKKILDPESDNIYNIYVWQIYKTKIHKQIV